MKFSILTACGLFAFVAPVAHAQTPPSTNCDNAGFNYSVDGTVFTAGIDGGSLFGLNAELHAIYEICLGASGTAAGVDLGFSYLTVKLDGGGSESFDQFMPSIYLSGTAGNIDYRVSYGNLDSAINYIGFDFARSRNFVFDQLVGGILDGGSDLAFSSSDNMVRVDMAFNQGQRATVSIGYDFDYGDITAAARIPFGNMAVQLGYTDVSIGGNGILLAGFEGDFARLNVGIIADFDLGSDFYALRSSVGYEISDKMELGISYAMIGDGSDSLDALGGWASYTISQRADVELSYVDLDGTGLWGAAVNFNF